MEFYGNYLKKSKYANGLMEFEVGVSDMGEDEITAKVENGVLTITKNGEVKYVTTYFNLTIKNQ